MRLARLRGSHADLPAAQAGQIERVHGLTEFEQHVVRDVHDVADRPDPGRTQTRLQPVGRGADRHISDRARIPWAQFPVFDDDVDVALIDRLERGQGQRRPAGHRPADLQAIGGRDLARDAGDRQAVGPVGGHLEVDDRVSVLEWLDAFDRESANRHRRGNLFGSAGDVHELAQP